MSDKLIECNYCGMTFTWTIKEQKRYEEKGFTPPRRCSTCRKNKKLPKDVAPQRNYDKRDNYDWP